MSYKKEIKGSTSAKVAGVIFCLNGFFVSASAIIFTSTLNISSVTLIIVGALTLLIGIGLEKLNMYAWATALILVSLSILNSVSNLIGHLTANQSITQSNDIVKLLWLILILWLLYNGRKACCADKEQSPGFGKTIKYYSPILIATALTVATIIIAKSYEAGGLLLLFFPLLVIEFWAINLIGENIQKKLGWNTLTVSPTPQKESLKKNSLT